MLGRCDGWLNRFKHRHSIKRHVFHGEATSVSESDHVQMKVVQITYNIYFSEDTHNMDETCLFWYHIPNDGLPSESYPSQNRDKRRIIVVGA